MQIGEMLSFPCLIRSKCLKTLETVKQDEIWNNGLGLEVSLTTSALFYCHSKMGSNIISFTQNLFIQIIWFQQAASVLL